MQVESQGKKYQQLYSIGSRGLNFVWHCMFAKLFGLLPKAVGSHWIILNRRMIYFREVILVYAGVNRCTRAEWLELPEGLQSMWDMMTVCLKEWREVDSFGRIGEEDRGRNQVKSTSLLWGTWLRGSAGEGWGSLGTFEKEIAFGYHAALLHLQMNSAASDSDWERIAGQEQIFISGARFRLTEGTWIIGLYGSHWLQSRNSPFSNAGH